MIVATIGNTLGSLVAYAIGAYGGRPFLERYGRYLLIRPHEIELADRFFERYGAATVFVGRLLPIVRTFISFPAGVARMPLGAVHRLLDAGAFLWSILLVYAGTVLGAHWVDIRHALQPFDLAIAVVVVAGVVGCSSGGGSGCLAGRVAPGLAEAWSRLISPVARPLRAAGPRELAVDQQVVHDLEATGQEERERRSRSARDQHARDRGRDRRPDRPRRCR